MARSGFTIIEVMVSLMIMTICAYLLSATITATMTHDVASRESTYASDICRNVLEDLRAEPFEQLFALYNADPSDDPDGAGTAPGCHFAVDILGADPDDEDGFVGEILFPRMGPELYENAGDAALTMPRDLNGDGWVDGLNHASDYIVIPVCVRLRWKGYAGLRTFQIATVMADMSKY